MADNLQRLRNQAQQRPASAVRLQLGTGKIHAAGFGEIADFEDEHKARVALHVSDFEAVPGSDCMFRFKR